MNWRTKLAGEIHDALLEKYHPNDDPDDELPDRAERLLLRAANHLADLEELHYMFEDYDVNWPEALPDVVQEVHNKRQALRRMHPPEIKPGPVPINMSMGNEAA